MRRKRDADCPELVWGGDFATRWGSTASVSPWALAGGLGPAGPIAQQQVVCCIALHQPHPLLPPAPVAPQINEAFDLLHSGKCLRAVLAFQ